MTRDDGLTLLRDSSDGGSPGHELWRNARATSSFSRMRVERRSVMAT